MIALNDGHLLAASLMINCMSVPVRNYESRFRTIPLYGFSFFPDFYGVPANLISVVLLTVLINLIKLG